jgi:hypothetical protein
MLGALGQQDPLSSAGLLGGIRARCQRDRQGPERAALGFDVMPLLSAVAPTMLNVISKTAKEQKLNSADIARILQADRAATSASAKPEVHAMVNEALHRMWVIRHRISPTQPTTPRTTPASHASLSRRSAVTTRQAFPAARAR